MKRSWQVCKSIFPHIAKLLVGFVALLIVLVGLAMVAELVMQNPVLNIIVTILLVIFLGAIGYVIGEVLFERRGK